MTDGTLGATRKEEGGGEGGEAGGRTRTVCVCVCVCARVGTQRSCQSDINGEIIMLPLYERLTPRMECSRNGWAVPSQRGNRIKLYSERKKNKKKTGWEGHVVTTVPPTRLRRFQNPSASFMSLRPRRSDVASVSLSHNNRK